MAANSVTKSTADTLLAAAKFLEMLTIWKSDPEPEIRSKQKFAKYHAARILKAIRSGEDPNSTNPVHESPAVATPAVLDPNDPEVQTLTQTPANSAQPHSSNPYQSYVETAPNTDAQPSPTMSAPMVSPPPILPSAPTDYSSHRDVSPMSQPTTSRQGSVVSEGGGYFPRVNVPTFTADNAQPNLPTAPSIQDETMGSNPFDPSSLTSSLPMGPAAPQAPNPQDFYQNTALPDPVAPTTQQGHAPQPPFQQSPNPYATPSSPSHPPVFQPTQSYQQFNNSFAPPQQHTHMSHPQQYTQPPQSVQHQGPFKTDEEAQIDATKHAKWAISALNFEDVNTAVKELRLALQSLGAN